MGIFGAGAGDGEGGVALSRRIVAEARLTGEEGGRGPRIEVRGGACRNRRPRREISKVKRGMHIRFPADRGFAFEVKIGREGFEEGDVEVDGLGAYELPIDCQ